MLALLKSLNIRAQEVVERTNTEVSSQTGGAVSEFMRVEDLADIAYQPSLCVSNSNFFKVRGHTSKRERQKISINPLLICFPRREHLKHFHILPINKMYMLKNLNVTPKGSFVQICRASGANQLPKPRSSLSIYLAAEGK
jgi:hypothetical protein